MTIWSSINCPTVIYLPAVCYFSREKPQVKSTAPGSIFYHICFSIYLLPYFLDLLFQKSKNTLLQFIILYFISRSRKIHLSNLLQFYLSFYPWRFDNPSLTSDCKYFSLCAGAVYVVLRGSPAGSITLVSSLREIPTIAMLHHPFLFGKIPTYF